MAKENSFDIVSKTDYAEVTNAINQTTKEVSQRFDFKGSKATVELADKDLVMSAEDETRLRNMNDIFQGKLVKRGVPIRNLDYGKVETAFGGKARQVVTLQQGISTEKGKEIVKAIKNGGFKKVQAQIQDDQVRVQSPSIDELQAVIALLKQEDFGVELTFGNFRS